MRRPHHPHNQLVRPLNEVLGTSANVGLLRALALSVVPLTSGELAKRAELGRTSIYPALRKLERAGIIEFVGAGSQRQIQLRHRHSLARALKHLFRAEANRFEALIAALRALLQELPLHPLSAWVDGRPQDERNDGTLSLFFVARPEDVEPLTDHLNARLSKVEHAYDVHIAVNAFTRSELETQFGAHTEALNEATLLDGVPPVALVKPSRPSPTRQTLRSHAEHDARSHRLALAIATKIKRDPGLLRLAEDRIKRRASAASPGERRELTEWMRILGTMSPARLRRFLVEDSPRAIRLRQSLPAMYLLSPKERDAVIRSETDADVITAVTRR